MLDLLLQEMSDLLASMKEVTENPRDFGDISRKLHRAAGAAAMFGLTGLHDVILRCEDAATQNHITGFERLLPCFEIQLEAAKGAIARWQTI